MKLVMPAAVRVVVVAAGITSSACGGMPPSYVGAVEHPPGYDTGYEFGDHLGASGWNAELSCAVRAAMYPAVDVEFNQGCLDGINTHPRI